MIRGRRSTGDRVPWSGYVELKKYSVLNEFLRGSTLRLVVGTQELDQRYELALDHPISLPGSKVYLT